MRSTQLVAVPSFGTRGRPQVFWGIHRLAPRCGPAFFGGRPGLARFVGLVVGLSIPCASSGGTAAAPSATADPPASALGVDPPVLARIGVAERRATLGVFGGRPRDRGTWLGAMGEGYGTSPSPLREVALEVCNTILHSIGLTCGLDTL